jgi:FkbM family methyltransferase
MFENNLTFPFFDGNCSESVINLISVSNSIKPGSINVAVDGGAGVGSFIANLNKAVPSIRIVGYEPLPENAKVLRKRFERNPMVDIRELAIGNKPGFASFEIPVRLTDDFRGWPKGTSCGGYLRKPGFIPFIKSVAKKILRRGWLWKNSNRHQSVNVRVTRLDSDLQFAPDFLKLDLQGGEPDALEGLGENLQHVKIVKVEVQMLGGEEKDRCIRLLQSAGFKFFIEDFQFGVGHMTDSLRTALEQNGGEIELEVEPSSADSSAMVIGKWIPGKPLPFKEFKLVGSLAKALTDAGATYFQVDIVALNQSCAELWNSAFLSRDGQISDSK